MGGLRLAQGHTDRKRCINEKSSSTRFLYTSQLMASKVHIHTVHIHMCAHPSFLHIHVCAHPSVLPDSRGIRKTTFYPWSPLFGPQSPRGLLSLGKAPGPHQLTYRTPAHPQLQPPEGLFCRPGTPVPTSHAQDHAQPCLLFPLRVPSMEAFPVSLLLNQPFLQAPLSSQLPWGWRTETLLLCLASGCPYLWF